MLGDITGRRLAELGCGNGNNAAHFATAGATVDAIDSAPEAIATASERWSHVHGLRLIQSDAAAFLAAQHDPYDVACSIFGALSFAGPELMGLIAERLRPGGVIAVSARLTRQANTRSADDWADVASFFGFSVRYWSIIEHPYDATPPPCLVFSAYQRPLGKERTFTKKVRGTGPLGGGLSYAQTREAP